MRRIVLVTVCVLLALGVGAGALLLTRDDAGGEPAAEQAGAMDAHPVAGTFEPDERKLAECEASDFRCIEQAFGNLAYAEGPERAIADFDAAMSADPAVESNCHRIAHTIGSAALARFEGDVGEAFAAGSASCWSGYYHGILERAFADLESLDDAGPVARELCKGERIEETEFLLYQCVHGLGHGLMIHSGYDLPWSLGICDQLADEWSQSSCTGGVFMENIASSYGVRSQWIRDDDPVYPCEDMEERHKYYCYLMVTSRVNELNGFDWADTARVCAGVERDWVAICFESYGRDASGSTRQDAAEIVRICGLAGRPAHTESCLYGAARDITSNDAGAERAGGLCERAAARYRERCYAGIGTILANLFPSESEQRRACAAAAPRRFVAACLGGAGLA
jgi:hypothetical protein